jgi:hypothetical protein
MEPIKQNESGRDREEKPRNLGEVIEQTTAKKKRIVRGVMNYFGTAVGTFIIFVAIVVSTTDITVMTALDWTVLGLSFFVFMFCAYAMYINGSGNGIRAGRKSETYLTAKKQYDDLKNEVITRKMQGRLPEFCRYYIEEELRNTRNSLLTEVGIDFAVYQERYVGKDKTELEQLTILSKSQVEAIVSANNIKPIKLTPEMILKRGRGSLHRNPLGIEPSKKRRIGYVWKFVSTFAVSVLMVGIALNPKSDLTWGTFAECILKLFPIVLNGFTGYKSGYENIVVDTVNYMNDQSDLLRQLIHYVEENPMAKPLVETAEVADERESIAPKITVGEG